MNYSFVVNCNFSLVCMSWNFICW
uniref:Uncharacterized protein n=1 Tax=Arundo donax TaxID=35708 RepID=A0A0A9CRP2_ARUDO